MWRKPHIASLPDWKQRGFPKRLWTCKFPDLPSTVHGVGITPQIAWIQLIMNNGLHHPLLYPKVKS